MGAKGERRNKRERERERERERKAKCARVFALEKKRENERGKRQCIVVQGSSMHCVSSALGCYPAISSSTCIHSRFA